MIKSEPEDLSLAHDEIIYPLWMPSLKWAVWVWHWQLGIPLKVKMRFQVVAESAGEKTPRSTLQISNVAPWLLYSLIYANIAVDLQIMKVSHVAYFWWAKVTGYQRDKNCMKNIEKRELTSVFFYHPNWIQILPIKPMCLMTGENLFTVLHLPWVQSGISMCSPGWNIARRREIYEKNTLRDDRGWPDMGLVTRINQQPAASRVGMPSANPFQQSLGMILIQSSGQWWWKGSGNPPQNPRNIQV